MNMFKGGMLQYRCKRCNTVYGNCHVPKILPTFVYLEGHGEEPYPMDSMVSYIDYHNCADGNLGIADLIGAELDKD